MERPAPSKRLVASDVRTPVESPDFPPNGYSGGFRHFLLARSRLSREFLKKRYSKKFLDARAKELPAKTVWKLLGEEVWQATLVWQSKMGGWHLAGIASNGLLDEWYGESACYCFNQTILDPSARGRGAYNILMSLRLAHAKTLFEKGLVKTLMVRTSPENLPVLHIFVEKLGFREKMRLPDFYARGKDAVILVQRPGKAFFSRAERLFPKP